MYNAEYEIKNKKYSNITNLIDNYEYEKALDSLVDFLVEYPNDEYGMFDYARCLMKTRKVDEGIQELELLRKKQPKKVLYKTYSLLLDSYCKIKKSYKCEDLLFDAKKALSEYEYNMLKIKYYYNIELTIEADNLVDNLKPTNEVEKAKKKILKYLFCNNEFLRKNKKDIEKDLSQFLKKRYITKGAARKIYLKLYIACSDYEKAYDYAATKDVCSIDALLLSYEICIKLNKKFEAEKILNSINNNVKKYGIKDLSLIKARVLFVNNRIEEAYEICKELAPTDVITAQELVNYSIKLNKTSDAIDIVKKFIDNNAITSKKMINLMEKLIGLYIYNKRYEEAYELFKKYELLIDSKNRDEYDLFLSKKLGLESKVKLYYYMVNQINEYSFKDAVDHIAQHKYENKNKAVHTVFNDDISINALINMIKPYLTQENLYEVGIINKYEIDCTNIDINEKRLVIGVFSDTGEIVFCYPSKNTENEYDIENEKNSKPVLIKKGIDRFNEKYSKFFQNNK